MQVAHVPQLLSSALAAVVAHTFGVVSSSMPWKILPLSQASMYKTISA